MQHTCTRGLREELAGQIRSDAAAHRMIATVWVDWLGIEPRQAQHLKSTFWISGFLKQNLIVMSDNFGIESGPNRSIVKRET